MARKLVIVESKAKARTIALYLGKDYDVKASFGHVRDLPEDEFGVDVEAGFEPTYKTLPRSERVVGQLRSAAGHADEVYLAPDPDREGEAIAWHLQHVLDLPDDKVQRVTFNEVTRSAVRDAFRSPRAINHDLVDAQQARRILDRIVGYELSPLVSRQIVRGLSAGRVQSVALRLIVERERERLAFVAEEYWEITAALSRGAEGVRFEAKLVRLDGEKAAVRDERTATQLVETLRGERFAVAEVGERTTSSKASPPFITSTLQQAANNILGYSADRTMRIAQQLYEGIEIGKEAVGLITYMRTDSTRVADQALEAVRALIGGSYGEPYLPNEPNVYPSPRGAQAAHEAIRPTDVARSPEDVRPYLSEQQQKLYELIWRRFVASQMTPARYKVRTADIEAGPAVFEARGRELLFDGYTRVMRPDQDGDDQALPDLSQGDVLALHALEPSQHFTQPPARYTEASLVRELEKQGIGRPSTYAPTISTLLRRNYVRRARRALCPTDLGMAVTDLLVGHFPREMDVSFTSRMEEQLDQIEEGQCEWRAVLAEFYEQFKGDLERARGQVKPEAGGPPVKDCPECGKPMIVRFSRKGDRFLGCTGFPECKHTEHLAREGEPDEVETEFVCDKCGAPMLRRVGKRGREYLACSAFPRCRNIMGLDREGKPVKLQPRTSTRAVCPKCGNEMHLAEGAVELTCSRCRHTQPLVSIAEALVRTEMTEEGLGTCGACGGRLVMKRGRRGMFLGCEKYPECKTIEPLPKQAYPAPQPTAERCDKCGRPLLVRWGQYGRFLACSGFPGCRNMWKLPGRPKKCPDCGDGCLMKKTGSDGATYYGCTRYPDCAHTEPDPKAGAGEEDKPERPASKRARVRKAGA